MYDRSLPKNTGRGQEVKFLKEDEDRSDDCLLTYSNSHGQKKHIFLLKCTEQWTVQKQTKDKKLKMSRWRERERERERESERGRERER